MMNKDPYSEFFENKEESPENLSGDDSIAYIFGERLYSSEGGLSEIHLVKRAGRLFIAKSLRPPYNVDPLSRAVLRKEFQIGFNIDLPGVVRTFDFSSILQQAHSLYSNIAVEPI